MMFSKSSDSTLDKATLLTTTFGKGTNLKHFLEQSKATNIQPITLSLIMTIATYALASGWNEYKMALYEHEGDSDDSAKDDDTDTITANTPIMLTPNPVLISQQELPDIVMTSVNQSVTSEKSWKEEINKFTCVTEYLQVKNQSSKGNTNWKKKSPANNSSKPVVIEVLTGYEISSLEEKERI
ncbi:hypothetical protein C1646_759415 [Rhizophagus diaphanus]|nr:hypothetical protein C1646_759415 [Rhizophagus diaphanus] [Rhizophagus sp. MUCL 43196]